MSYKPRKGLRGRIFDRVRLYGRHTSGERHYKIFESSVSDVKGTDDMWMSITKLKQLTNANLIQKPEILLKHISINI